MQWGLPTRKVDFHDLKGDLESLAPPVARSWSSVSTRAYGHPARSAEVLRDGVAIGWIGQVHPRLARAMGIEADVYAFELDLEPLTARRLPRAGELSRFRRCAATWHSWCLNRWPGPIWRRPSARPLARAAARPEPVRPLCRPGRRAGIQESRYGLDFAGQVAHSDGPRREAVVAEAVMPSSVNTTPWIRG